MVIRITVGDGMAHKEINLKSYSGFIHSISRSKTNGFWCYYQTFKDNFIFTICTALLPDAFS